MAVPARKSEGATRRAIVKLLKVEGAMDSAQLAGRVGLKANRLFPDAYAELSVALIDALGQEFGSSGMQRILDARCAAQRAAYARRIPATMPLSKKLRELARIRTEEGYMAEVRAERGGFLFIENHCPICAAATVCQGFCATELDLFRSVLGRGVRIERVEHIVAGARRCAYRVRIQPATP